MTDMTPTVDDTAAAMTFGLLRDAYLELASAILRIDEAPARELLEAVETRTTLRVTSLGHDLLKDPRERVALATAATPVLCVLREAQTA